MSMKFKVHGVRGSFCNPSISVAKYGGNTSCYEIEGDEFQIILDTGTGFHDVKLNHRNKHTAVLFSHFHHDHIQGLSFNKYIYESHSSIILSSALCTAEELEKIIGNYFSSPYFPIDFIKQLDHLKIIDFQGMQEHFNDKIKIQTINLRHPGGASGYRFEDGRNTIVTLFDNEYEEEQNVELVNFCKGADLVVWDGMFKEKELALKYGWGHSSIERANEFARLGSIKKILITHHSPDRTDDELDEISKSLSSNVGLAYEKQIISF